MYRSLYGCLHGQYDVDIDVFSVNIYLNITENVHYCKIMFWRFEKARK